MKIRKKSEISAAERTGGLPWVDLDVWEGRRGHPDARAESLISASLESISVAERTSFLPWVDLGV